MTWFTDNPLERLMRQKPLPEVKSCKAIMPHEAGQPPEKLFPCERSACVHGTKPVLLKQIPYEKMFV